MTFRLGLGAKRAITFAVAKLASDVFLKGAGQRDDPDRRGSHTGQYRLAWQMAYSRPSAIK